MKWGQSRFTPQNFWPPPWHQFLAHYAQFTNLARGRRFRATVSPPLSSDLAKPPGSLRARPSCPATLALHAKYVAAVLGREGEAMDLMQRALRLNPHAPTWYFSQLLTVAYFAGDFEAVVAAAARAPRWPIPLLLRACALAQLGRTAEAAIVKREFDDAWKQATSPLSVDALF